MYFPGYRSADLRIKLFFWRQGGYKTGNIVVGSLATNGLWRPLAKIGFFIPRDVGRSFYFDSMQFGYWVNRGATMSPAVLRFLFNFAMNFYSYHNLFNKASLSSFLDNKLLYFRATPASRLRYRGLRSASIELTYALLRKRHKSRLSRASVSFRRRRSYLIKLASLVAKHTQMQKENVLSTV